MTGTPMPSLELLVLGAPQLSVNGVPSPLSGRPLIALARMALSRTALSAERLRDDVWPDDSGTLGNVQVTLSRLRSTVGRDAVMRSNAGYSAVGISVDSSRFEASLAAARRTGLHAEARLDEYEVGLGMWTGSAFEGVRGGPWFDAEARRLDDLRESAIDEQCEMLLELGRTRQAIDILRTAVASTPAREPRAALLMLALYRAGLQREALNVFDTIRHELRENYGLIPSPAIVDLEHRILQHDPTLAASASARPISEVSEVEANLRAAEALIRSGATADASRLLDAAAERALSTGDPVLAAQVDVARARALMMTGTGDAAPLLDGARTLARQRRNGELLAAVAFATFGAGLPISVDDALVSFLEPLALLPPDAPAAVDLLCCAAASVTFANGSDTAGRLLDEAERVHARQQSARSDAALRVTRSLYSAVQGASAQQLADEAADVWATALTTGDPAIIVIAAQSLLRCAYERGDLDTVDAVLPHLEQASRIACLPFGLVRAALCATTNAIARGQLHSASVLLDHEVRLAERLRTAAGPAVIRIHRLLLMLEQDRLADMLPAARAAAASRHGASSWNAVLALAGDDESARQLLDVADEVPRNDAFDSFVALAAEVACRRGDRELARWCLTRLDALGDGTIVVGIGSCALGYAHHYAGLALTAIGDTAAARTRLEHAVRLAADNGAHLWWAHSAVALAAVLADAGEQAQAGSLLALVDDTQLPAKSARLRRLVQRSTGRSTLSSLHDGSPGG